MGGKPSNAMGRDRPESGGADKDMAREKSGILEQDKQKFAQEESEERRSAQTDAEQTGSPAPFSIDSPPNSDPRK
ncbi:MAG: hypothetical protein ABI601_15465 [bacterium]